MGQQSGIRSAAILKTLRLLASLRSWQRCEVANAVMHKGSAKVATQYRAFRHTGGVCEVNELAPATIPR